LHADNFPFDLECAFDLANGKWHNQFLFSPPIPCFFFPLQTQSLQLLLIRVKAKHSFSPKNGKLGEALVDVDKVAQLNAYRNLFAR